MKTLIPKFRFGHIDPAAVEARRARRGPGYEFYQIVPNDIMLVTAVLGIKDFTRDAVEAAIPNYWNCVDALAQEKVDVFVLGGTPVSAQLGRARVVRLLREAEDKTGIRGDAPLEAAIAAMQHLGLKKIAVGARWTDEFNQAVVRYLEDGGLQVVAITKRGQWGKEAFAMSFEEGLNLALDVGREAARMAPQAEAIFVPGGATMSLHVIPVIEEEFGKPTFTRTSAEVWRNLVFPGVIPPVAGWGRLLESGSRRAH
jgi:maleate cis-trans isomerase